MSFISFPKKIVIGETTLSPYHVPKHFSSRLDFLNDDFRGISYFKNTATIEPTIAQDVVSFFQTASPIKYSLVVTAFCAVLLLLLLMIGLCYLQIPNVLATILCCFSKKCFLQKKALQRNQDQSHLRVIYTANSL